MARRVPGRSHGECEERHESMKVVSGSGDFMDVEEDWSKGHTGSKEH